MLGQNQYIRVSCREEVAARLEKRQQLLDKKRREAKKWEDLQRSVPQQLAGKFSR